MNVTQKALYNSLRITWLQDQTSDIPYWKVQDYRPLPSPALFESLASQGLFIDKNTFFLYANEVDTPEELVDHLIDTEDPEIHDRIYLIIFELWRRLLPEKLSISIICDELDYQIFCYDEGLAKSEEPLENAIRNFLLILRENVEKEALNPEEAFISMSASCSHDVIYFLYDYIAEQIDFGQIDFATELLDGFYEFMPEKFRFDFLLARITSISDFATANQKIAELLETSAYEPEFILYLDILTFLVQGGTQSLFVKVASKALALIETEEDFIEILRASADFYHCLDLEAIESTISNLIEHRKPIAPDMPITANEPDVKAFKKILLANS